MSTIETFEEMSGILEPSCLTITAERAEEIINTVSATANLGPSGGGTSTPVTLLPVSTYVHDSKDPDFGSASVHPKKPPFASHWGIVVGDLLGGRPAFLFHLVMRCNGADHKIEFAVSKVNLESRWIVGASVKPVGETRYSIWELSDIGDQMIKVFGNYHTVFWNCQTFAKCYLRVITGTDAAFAQWTSADATNLFLCALVVPMPIASTSKRRERQKMKHLVDVGGAATAELGRIEGRKLTEEETFRASDAVIDLMMEAWSDDETLKSLSRPIKDSADKVGLMSTIKANIQKALGISS